MNFWNVDIPYFGSRECITLRQNKCLWRACFDVLVQYPKTRDPSWYYDPKAIKIHPTLYLSQFFQVHIQGCNKAIHYKATSTKALPLLLKRWHTYKGNEKKKIWWINETTRQNLCLYNDIFWYDVTLVMKVPRVKIFIYFLQSCISTNLWKSLIWPCLHIS